MKLEYTNFIEVDKNEAHDAYGKYRSSMRRRRPGSELEKDSFMNHVRYHSDCFPYKDSYIFGNFNGVFFRPSHFAPANMRQGVEALKELIKYNNVVFTVTEDLISMLERIGYHNTSIKFPMYFRNQLINKHVLTSSEKMCKDLQEIHKEMSEEGFYGYDVEPFIVKKLKGKEGYCNSIENWGVDTKEDKDLDRWYAVQDNLERGDKYKMIA